MAAITPKMWHQVDDSIRLVKGALDTYPPPEAMTLEMTSMLDDALGHLPAARAVTSEVAEQVSTRDARTAGELINVGTLLESAETNLRRAADAPWMEGPADAAGRFQQDMRLFGELNVLDALTDLRRIAPFTD